MLTLLRIIRPKKEDPEVILAFLHEIQVEIPLEIPLKDGDSRKFSFTSENITISITESCRYHCTITDFNYVVYLEILTKSCEGFNIIKTNDGLTIE